MKAQIFLMFLWMVLAFPAWGESDVMKDVFENVKAQYVGQISNREIAFKGLKALTKQDKEIHVLQKGNQIILQKDSQTIGTYTMPSDTEGSKKWADFCRQIITKAAQKSEKIEVHDFEMPDKFAASVLNGLDGHSRYFSVFSEEVGEEGIKVKRAFASRVIDNVLLIRIVTFKKGISEQVKTAVFECSKCEGIILDLRGNQGGFLNEALKIADLFLDEGIITYTLSDENGVPQYYSATSGDMAGAKPMVILVDGSTASAAEVLAGALSEQNRAILIGTKTYGKGSVQDVKKMDKERAMAVTSTYFYTPSGLKIDKIGLSPQICVAQSDNCDGEDRFSKEEDIERAVLYLKTGL